MPSLVWHFDFISPYAYLGLHALRRLPEGSQIQYRPVLFAGLLNHFGQKGPAEIAPKRKWTYRSCIWLARQNQIPFRMPATHPFNPLGFLRLAVAAGSTPTAIEIIFRTLWATGLNPGDPLMIEGLEIFWGSDAVDFAAAYLKNPGILDEEMLHADALPIGAFRPGAT